MNKIRLIPKAEFERVERLEATLSESLSIYSDMCRLNTLVAVKHAGSGHLGSSFSAMDIATWLYLEEMNTRNIGWESPERDIYFSSKGHDVPGLYAMLFSLGVLSKPQLLMLRKLGGLPGHPDICIDGVEANSGSLGMGISKGRGMAWAKKQQGCGGRVVVLTGDGEWQEGQNYEALQAAAQQKIDNLIVIMDHNKVQSDKYVESIMSIGDIEGKMKNFGWHVSRCDGHDFDALNDVFREFEQVRGTPKILIADTIKGRGVSFMEHPHAIQKSGGTYLWHAGAPADDVFEKAFVEIKVGIDRRLEAKGAAPLFLELIEGCDLCNENNSKRYSLEGEPASIRAKAAVKEYIADDYGDALVELAADRSDIVVLDADLAKDCRIRAFEERYPDRFVENGIAEQDMVSMAGGIARMGYLPVVNSFASFLASRANEQIYNNATEHTKIIYVGHYAGLIPAGPGMSHQSIRDISLLGAIPNIEIIHPCNKEETRMALEYCVNVSECNCMLRLPIGPSPRIIHLPRNYEWHYGRGCRLATGKDALLIAYGPVMLHEALLASEILRHTSDVNISVANMPWLNRVDEDWLLEEAKPHRAVYVLEDHSIVGGLGDFLISKLSEMSMLNRLRVYKLGIRDYPACGSPPEVLSCHGLDGISIAKRLEQDLK